MTYSPIKRTVIPAIAPTTLVDVTDMQPTEESSPLFLTRVPIQDRQALMCFAKRTLDVTLVLVALCFLLPVILLVSIAIKLTSPGPIIFSQERVGLGGRLFKCHKFRSMITNAESLKATLVALNDNDGPIFKMKRDPRVTKVGRFIRKYSIDEIPQLFNILKGDMSIVGPRPLPTHEVRQLESWQLRRHSVLPGLTCTWQTSGRSNISFDEWMRMDLKYIDTWSLGQDLRLILKTIKVVLSADGAY